MNIKVISVVDDDYNFEKGTRVTLERGDGKTVTVNIADICWDGRIYGLNLVFDHSGEGDHYT